MRFPGTGLCLHHDVSMTGSRAEVLVLVKATPQPSATYGETVCVAGLVGPADDPKWIRLYPVPFRYLDGERQFHKYQLIEVTTRDASADKRPESHKITADSIKINGELKTWGRRAEWIERVPTPTMCSLQAAVRENINSSSLAAVRPARVDKLSFAPHPGWTPVQLARFEAYRSQGTLFDDIPLPLLQPPRFRVHLHYTCEESGCGGHQQTIIDWELTALQARLRAASDHELQAVITQNFFNNPFSARKDPLIFVGNQEDIRRRASFTVLGLYYPRRHEAEKGRTLF